MAERGLIVLVAFALFLTAARARAGFNYDTTITFSPAGPGGTSPGVTIAPASMVVNGFNENGYLASFGGSSVELRGTSRGGFFVPGRDTLDGADLAATSTTPAGLAGDSFTLGYTVNLTLTNNPPPGSAASQNFAVSGMLTLNDINAGNGTITNAFTTPTSGNLTLGGVSFIADIDSFSPPTINGSFGSIGGDVQAAAVPEPASASLFVLSALPLLRRTRRA